MKNLIFIPIIILILIVPSTAYAHIYTEIFSDDFNRPDDPEIGNGWVDAERESGPIAELFQEALWINGDDGETYRACAYHRSIIPAADYLQINYTYSLQDANSDIDFIVHLKVGENLHCGGPNANRIASLFQASASRVGTSINGVVATNGGFGHFGKSPEPTKSNTGIVDGPVNISMVFNIDDSVYSYNVTGDGSVGGDIIVKNVPFMTSGILDTTVFQLTKVDAQIFPVIIDDFTVNTFPEVVGTCGIIPIDNFDYGLVTPGQTSDAVPIEIITTGDKDSIVSVSATDWTRSDKSTITIIPSENTHFTTIENLPYDSMTTLTDTLKEIGVLSHHYSYTTYWKTHVPIDITHEGELFQTMTFDAKCN